MMVLVFVVLWVILYKMLFGCRIYVIGGNEKVVFILGIKVLKVKVMIYLLVGLLVVLLGVILIFCLNFV